MKQEGIALPGMIIIAQLDGQEQYVAFPFPDPGTTPDSGTQAGEQAIEILKEHSE
jgi:hypothetical protein